MSRQPKLRPKSHIPGFPDAIYNLAAVSSLSQLESRAGLGEEKHDQRVFRVKRKHVLKACDRCRVKKTKCDGKQPCNRCSAYNHPCLFRERKATQTKVYSRGFVEMLESHHSLVVKALQRLYKLCLDKEGFPGEPLVEVSDGHPLTHAILDRLGLIKQAEENPDEPEEDSEDLRYLRFLSTSTDCSATADPSPEPATPPDPSPSNCSPVTPSSKGNEPWKWELQPVQPLHSGQYDYPHPGYHPMAMPRPSMEPTALHGETKSSEIISSMPDHGHSLYYYMGASCDEGPAKNRLEAEVAARRGSQQPATASGFPVVMMNDYNLHVQDHQSVYPSLPSGWAYTCG
ncbi:C6 transcription factor [Aspergillus sclerotiicarbonarius CBS 121057]|uniref:C6 transcription factor n=1 Tax=Aspergillus sclerotiicarbonarius (strain CBS 121057 / IBT 28362) TaxID=1448318 RepID=A0A319DRT1_ASPSB|nr:C6 transcription factor [Aspergillus sclerotiicarbonarius CBS 121057]